MPNIHPNLNFNSFAELAVMILDSSVLNQTSGNL